MNALIANLKTKALSFLNSLKGEITDTWERVKIPLLAIAAILATFKFKELLLNYLVRSGENEVKETNKTDQKLATQEKKDSDQADVLVANANALPSEQPPVTPDWYKKK